MCLKTEIQISEYSSSNGMLLKWENTSSIKVEIEEGEVCIKANVAGLRSLANHLLNLAQEKVPQNIHLHLDDMNGLEEGSCGLIIEKK